MINPLGETVNKTVLIKLGGSILHNDTSATALCHNIKTMIENGFKLIIVHGGSKAIEEALAVYQIQSTFIHGLRKTSHEAMKIIEMVLTGQVNQSLTRQLNHLGVPAVGLSGASNHMLHCEPLGEEYGLVGDIKTVNVSLIQSLLNASKAFIPVIASIGVDGGGNPLNINADLAAAALACALKVQQLIYVTDQTGIYNHEGNVLSTLSDAHLADMIEKATVKNGMLVKVKAIREAIKRGMDSILIANGHQKNMLTDALLGKKSIGTLCVKNKQ